MENKKKKIVLSADSESVELLEKFCERNGISVNQFVLNCIASRFEVLGYHFFWVNHKDI